MKDWEEQKRRQARINKVFARITPLPHKVVFEGIPRADENYWRDRFATRNDSNVAIVPSSWNRDE